MGMLDGIKNYFNNKSEEREEFEKLQRQADLQRRQFFIEEFKKNALEVAMATAKREAEDKSGLAKLRATNRTMSLNHVPEPGSMFEKLAQYTQKNIARREQNLKHTETMRQQALQQQNENKENREIQRGQRMNNSNIGLGKCKWRL